MQEEGREGEEEGPGDWVAQLRALPGNDVCGDCGDAIPAWVVPGPCILVCLSCAGLHRGLHRVRSLGLDLHTPQQRRDMLQAGGNTRALQQLQGWRERVRHLPPLQQCQSWHDKYAYILAKYGVGSEVDENAGSGSVDAGADADADAGADGSNAVEANPAPVANQVQVAYSGMILLVIHRVEELDIKEELLPYIAPKVFVSCPQSGQKCHTHEGTAGCRNPSFDYNLGVCVSNPQDTVEFEVIDEGTWRPNIFLGKAEVRVCELVQDVPQEMELPLTGVGSGKLFFTLTYLVY